VERRSVIRPLTIRENYKLLKLSESLRRASRSISATGRYDLAVEIDRATTAILRAMGRRSGTAENVIQTRGMEPMH
jgi:hypothetical protein